MSIGARRLGLALFAAASLSSCDKLTLDENLYTAPVGGMDASVPRLDSGPVVLTRDGGDATGSFDAELPAPTDELAAKVLAECGPPPSPLSPFSRPALLETVGRCARREYCEFNVYARELVEQTMRYASDPREENRVLARRAWLLANQQFQRVELFRIGPALPGNMNGAQNLREPIHSFPSTDRCLVDEQLVSERYNAARFASSPPTGRGLRAIEYLLFDESLANGCSAIAQINMTSSWQTLAARPEELKKRKREYAAAASRSLQQAAQALNDAWDPAKGNFGRMLSMPGPSSVYMTEQSAISAIASALYFIEDVKDGKLLRVLPGMSEECPNGCPDRLEAPYAGVSGENVRQNLAGFRALFQGCSAANEGLGVDDLLNSLGPAGSELTQRILAALAAAERAHAELGASLEVAAVEDVERVRVLYFAIRDIRDLVTGQLYGLLDVEPPARPEGDND